MSSSHTPHSTTPGRAAPIAGDSGSNGTPGHSAPHPGNGAEPVKRSSTTVRIRRRHRPSSSTDSSSASPLQRQRSTTVTRPRRSTQGVSYAEGTDDEDDLIPATNPAGTSASATQRPPMTASTQPTSPANDQARRDQQVVSLASRSLTASSIGAGNSPAATGSSSSTKAGDGSRLAGTGRSEISKEAMLQSQRELLKAHPDAKWSKSDGAGAGLQPMFDISLVVEAARKAQDAMDEKRHRERAEARKAGASGAAVPTATGSARPPSSLPTASTSSPASAQSKVQTLPLRPQDNQQLGSSTSAISSPLRGDMSASASPQRKASGTLASPLKNVQSGEGVSALSSASLTASAAAPRAAVPAGLPGSSTGPQVSPTKGRPRKKVPKFVTSRSYAPNVGLPSDDANVQPAKEGGMKRMDRKYKSGSATPDALSAAVSDPRAVLTAPPDPNRHPARRAHHVAPTDPIPLQTAEDMSSTASKALIPSHVSSPRHPPSRTRPRLFELDEAPTFRPTWEEFANPMKYIEWVSSSEGGNGTKYGIVKVIPPEGWHMDCVLDQSKFRFRTRVQQLNSLTADARATQNYQEQLQKFHSQQGSPRVSIPVIDRRPVDLYQLKLAVKAAGGYDVVSRGRRWAELAKTLGYAESLAAHIAPQVKAAYAKIILPFEAFLARARDQAKGTNGSPGDQRRQSTGTPAGDDGKTTADLTKELLAAGMTPEEVALAQADAERGSKRRSSRKRADTQTTNKRGASGRSRRHTRQDSDIDPDDLITVNGAEEQMCEICLRGDNGMAMLLCDECNRGYHMYCLDPPLATIPKSQWFCPPCLVGTGNDYGFDDGETHSLDSFWKRSDAFRRSWFREHPDAIWDGKQLGNGAQIAVGQTNFDGDITMGGARPGVAHADNGVCRAIAGTDLRVSEDDVEREFWRLVESSDETVEVEYGADVHSTTHGSASPTLETHPLSSYARDGWNLNNLPILPNSLLRYIKSDISGMTVPWLYVGMMFSTFCWHNEDHYTYSINYQHWGDTKTWYGIPGGDANKFEEAMRRVAPDLFETSPDLLFQLVTMMSPQKLSKEGVKVYACDQRANEFVITYPKAYHSGFNHGFNLNEAVNFALPDWIKFDLEAVLRYQSFARPPVFSHDELLITASQHNTSLETSIWLQEPMKEMVERELRLRNALRDTVSGLQEVVEERDRAEESEYQCSHCNCFCYLAQIVSPNVTGVACLEHGFEVCKGDNPGQWTLRMRFSDEQLQGLLEKISDRAEHPAQWQKRFRKLLLAHARPPLRSLRSLLQEGERLGTQVPEVEQLREFVAVANDWVQDATKLMPKRYGGRPTGNVGRKRRSAVTSLSPTPRQETAGVDDSARTELPSVEDLTHLLAEADSMPFDAPEIQALREAVVMVQNTQYNCGAMLKRIEDGGEPSLAECESVLVSCEGLNVDVEQYNSLKQYSLRRKWIEELDGIWDNHINYQEVQEFLKEFAGTGLPTSHHYYAGLQDRLTKGDEWKKEADAILSGDSERTLERLERLTSTEDSVPVVPEMHVELEDLLKAAKDCLRTITSIRDDTDHQQGKDAELSDARKVLRAVHNHKLDIEEATQLQRDVDLHDEWRSDMLEAVVNVFQEYDEVLSGKQVQEAVNDFVRRATQGGSLAVSQVKGDTQSALVTKDLCFCGIAIVPWDKHTGRLLQCQKCKIHFHDRCARPVNPDEKDDGDEDLRSYRTPLSANAQAKWKCALCRPSGLPRFLRSRHATILKFLADLFQPKYAIDMLRFLPSEYERLQGAFKKAKEHYEAVRTLLDDVLLKKEDHKGHREVLHGLCISPVDFDAGSGVSPINRCVLALFSAAGLDSSGKPIRGRHTGAASGSRSFSGAPSAPGATPTAIQDSSFVDQSGDVSMLDSMQPDEGGLGLASGSEGPGGHAQASAPSGPDMKRKRGKRAKFVFREEVGIWVPVQGERIYCLCHRKETGDMICCDRCMLWFHNACVHIPPNFEEQKWHCPMCCTKTEKKYPHAEVKVREMGVTDPDKWLDVRSSLRSTRRPISKIQTWSVPPEKRIVLHLDSFYPAIHAEPSGPEQAKRIRVHDGVGNAAPVPQAGPSTIPADMPVKTFSRAGAKDSPIVLGEDDDDAADHSVHSASMRQASVVARPTAQVASGYAEHSSPPHTQQSPASRQKARPTSKQPAHSSPHQQPGHSAPIQQPQSGSKQQGRIGAATARMHAAETDEERYQAGMANLRARGVSDAMINRYAVGWNGHTLVFPRYDPDNPAAELDLGPTIQLAPNDPDGSILIRSAKARQLQQDLAAGILRPPGMGFGHPAPVHRGGPGPVAPPPGRQPYAQPTWATRHAPSTYGSMHKTHRSPDPWHEPYFGYTSPSPAMRLPDPSLPPPPPMSDPRSPAPSSLPSGSPASSHKRARPSDGSHPHQSPRTSLPLHAPGPARAGPPPGYDEGYHEPYPPQPMYPRVPSEGPQAPRSPAVAVSQPAPGPRPTARPAMPAPSAEVRPSPAQTVQSRPAVAAPAPAAPVPKRDGNAAHTGSIPPAPHPVPPQPSLQRAPSVPAPPATKSVPAPAAAAVAPVAGSSASPTPPVLPPGIAAEAGGDAREVYRQMAKRMKPDADEAELEKMVDRILAQ